MLKALKANELTDKYCLELLKFSLSGNQNDFWKTYDEILQTLGYARIFLESSLDQTFVVKNYENIIFSQYKAFNDQKIQAIDLLQTIEMKKYWLQKRYNSDKFQRPNFIHCILTPLKFSLSSQISKMYSILYCYRSDYKLSPYAFYLKDIIVHSNKISLNKGILKGLPISLGRKIDPDTKFIELNRFSHSQFQEIFYIFIKKYNQFNPFLKGEEIHFTFQYQTFNENMTGKLKVKMQAMLQDLYQISGLRMFAFVSRNQLICDILVKDSPIHMIENKKSSISILIHEKEIKQTLMKCKISSIPGICLSQTRFLSPNIKTVKQLLENLDVLQIITSQQQTLIFFQTCLGIDHRQNLQYIQIKRDQFSALELNYDSIVPTSLYLNIELLLERQNYNNTTIHKSKNFDLESVRSDKLLDANKAKPANLKNESNVSTKASGKQQYFPVFGQINKK